MQEHGLFYCFKHRSVAKIMTVPCDYPFLARFMGALILLYKLALLQPPSNWSGIRNASTVSIKQARKVKRYQRRGIREGNRVSPYSISAASAPRYRRGNADDPHPEPWRSKQGIFRGFLTTKLHTSCNKAVKQSVDASL